MRNAIISYVVLGLVVFIATLSLAPLSFAVNQDQLWLPRDYYRHFRSLNEAAEISEQTERCDHVIAGTLSQERSTKEHPVFVVTCRDQERQTFAYIIDGLSLEILNRPPPDPEALAQKELQQRLEKRWLPCYQQLKLRTQGLRNTSLSPEVPHADMQDEDNLTFAVEFNATSKIGKGLSFLANCAYVNGNKSVEIHPVVTPNWENKDEPDEVNIVEP